MITASDTDRLRVAVKDYMDFTRYSHTLGVEREVRRMGELLLSDDVEVLAAAALLHDITRIQSAEKQLQYLEEFGIIKDDFKNSPTELLHAVTAAEIIRRDFPRFADERIISAVRWHTTGRWGLTVFETILFLADYTEDTRTYPDCVRLREYFWGKDPSNMTESERIVHLLRCAEMSCSQTISLLEKNNRFVDPGTVECRDFLRGILETHAPDDAEF